MHAAIPVLWPDYRQPGGDMLSQHLTGTMKEQLFLFLLEEETAAVSCSQDRCKQQIWHWRHVTLWQGKSVASPLSGCARRGVCLPVWFMVFNSPCQQKSTCLSVRLKTPTENCVAIPQKPFSTDCPTSNSSKGAWTTMSSINWWNSIQHNLTCLPCSGRYRKATPWNPEMFGQ